MKNNPPQSPLVRGEAGAFREPPLQSPSPDKGRVREGLGRVKLGLVLLFGVNIGLSGCAEVAPWERGHLAKPHMALEPHAASRMLREHSYMSREAALGGLAGGGGGCGCY
jgi:hypothetical protein